MSIRDAQRLAHRHESQSGRKIRNRTVATPLAADHVDRREDLRSHLVTELLTRSDRYSPRDGDDVNVRFGTIGREDYLSRFKRTGSNAAAEIPVEQMPVFHRGADLRALMSSVVACRVVSPRYDRAQRVSIDRGLGEWSPGVSIGPRVQVFYPDRSSGIEIRSGRITRPLVHLGHSSRVEQTYAPNARLGFERGGKRE